MKFTHLDAHVRSLPYKHYKDTAEYLKGEYVENKRTLDDVADELDIGVQKLRAILAYLHIEKPRREIPVTLDQARRMSIDDLGLLYKVSRATAWRWKRAILNRAADAEASLGDDVLGAGVK